MNTNENFYNKEDRILNLKDKVEFFKEKKVRIFIKTFEGLFYEGFILQVTDKRFVLLDKYKREMPISFSELERIEEYVNKEEADDNEK